MGKILVSASHFDTLCKDAWKLLEENGHEVIFDGSREFPAYSEEELLSIIGQIDAALIGMDVFDEKILKAAPDLKAVAKFGVGVDNIDGEAAKRYGIKVLNAPGQNSNAVAELAVGLILDLLRKVVPLHNEVEKGRWPRNIGSELKGKTVGLLGFGAIARLVARKLAAFDVRLIACDLFPNWAAAEELGVRLTTQEEVITQSDVLSIHIPATRETQNMFNDEMFLKMKKGAYIVNTARGALIDTDALIRALKKGHLAGVGLDAFVPEPLPADSELFECDNVVLTPHTGSETAEAYYNVSMTTCKDIIAVLAGREPVHWTNR
ncbi:phosphoglycerate dehydrogenase [Clostridium sp. C105KSO13]|uniref:phosphoglycerate dehydrogenase n=1 Tax=Clostridium sp. C105KSO13 TaxID=1776045 RepID=UPI00074079B2|nr:phosphoglycerate dehydrogenase [Clostridium sp. C105KSO13]CUX17587.1 D-3-phosphoglycerate dehydrogenase [Clostridium sp. C105KSO13]